MQFVGMQFAWKHVFFLFSRGQIGMSNRTARSHNEPGFFGEIFLVSRGDFRQNEALFLWCV